MQQNFITAINGVDIITVDHQGETYVPIKPICDAIGIAVEGQREKIQSDETLSSTAMLSMVVAADGKEREMLCLPLRYVYAGSSPLTLRTSPRPHVRPSPATAASVTTSSIIISQHQCSAPSKPTTPRSSCSGRSTRPSLKRKKPKADAVKPRKHSIACVPNV